MTNLGASEHKRMRGLVAPSLSPESLKAMTPQIYAAAEDVRHPMLETMRLITKYIRIGSQSCRTINFGKRWNTDFQRHGSDRQDDVRNIAHYPYFNPLKALLVLT